MIRARQLSKWFGQVMALNSVDVEVGPGVTGLLGPNGAGKTTFLRLLTGQLRPSQGSITIDEQPVWGNAPLMARVGFCPDEDAFYDDLTGLEFVTTLARLSGLDRGAAGRCAREAIERVDMSAAAGRRIRGYSRGMRQRIKFAQALVHDPDVLVFDEPLTGTDPVGRRALRDLIAGLAAEGKTVLVSSHVLHEVESLTASIVLIYRGRVVASGDVREIRDLMDEHPHRIRVRCDRPRELAAALTELEGVVGVELSRAPPGLVVHSERPAALFDRLPGLLLGAGIRLDELASEDDSLEAVFRYLVGRRA